MNPETLAYRSQGDLIKIRFGVLDVCISVYNSKAENFVVFCICVKKRNRKANEYIEKT